MKLLHILIEYMIELIFLIKTNYFYILSYLKMKTTNFNYDNMNLIIYDWFLKTLYFKDQAILIHNTKDNIFIINKKLFHDNDLYKSRSLWIKVKKFFRYYLWYRLDNKNQFMNFINNCFKYNDTKIRLYNHYIHYNWLNIF